MTQADSHNGYYHKNESQQALMQKLVSHLDPQHQSIFHDPSGNFRPLCEWKGLTVNRRGDVTRIDWRRFFHKDSRLDFAYIPCTVEYFRVSDCCLAGQLSLKKFPRCLKQLDLSGNYLQGGIQLVEMSSTMEDLDVGRNDLDGSLDMTRLPDSLRSLCLANNGFSGPLRLTNLPDGLIFLDLSENRFTDNIYIDNIPRALVEINLSANPIDEVDLLKNCHDCPPNIVLLNDKAVPSKGRLNRTVERWLLKHHEAEDRWFTYSVETNYVQRKLKR